MEVETPEHHINSGEGEHVLTEVMEGCTCRVIVDIEDIDSSGPLGDGDEEQVRVVNQVCA